MRNQHNRRPVLVAQVPQEFEDFRLDCDVQRGGGFIGDDQARVQGQGCGDDHPLLLSPRELVGVVIDPVFRIGDAYLPEGFDGPRLRFPGGNTLSPAAAMGTDAFGDLPPSTQILCPEPALDKARSPTAAVRSSTSPTFR